VVVIIAISAVLLFAGGTSTSEPLFSKAFLVDFFSLRNLTSTGKELLVLGACLGAFVLMKLYNDKADREEVLAADVREKQERPSFDPEEELKSFESKKNL